MNAVVNNDPNEEKLRDIKASCQQIYERLVSKVEKI